MSARFGEGLAAAILLRRKRRADAAAASPPPAPEQPRPPAPSVEDEPDALDLIDEEAAQAAGEDIGDCAPAPEAAQESEAVAERVRRHRRYGYPFGSIGCRNTCGDGAA